MTVIGWDEVCARRTEIVDDATEKVGSLMGLLGDYAVEQATRGFNVSSSVIESDPDLAHIIWRALLEGLLEWTQEQLKDVAEIVQITAAEHIRSTYADTLACLSLARKDARLET